MKCSRATMSSLLLLLVMLCLLQESSGHYRGDRYRSRRTYSSRRWRSGSGRYMGGGNRYFGSGRSSMRTLFNRLYNHYRNDDHDDYDGPYSNDRRHTVVIHIPPTFSKTPNYNNNPNLINILASNPTRALLNNPNFKMSDLPGYLSSGVFDRDSFSGIPGLGPLVPSPIIDPINPTGDFDDRLDEIRDDLRDIGLLGGSPTLFSGANNILGSNPLGGGAANGNLLGKANANLLGGANANLLGGANTNLLANTNAGNLLGNPNANLLGGTSTNLLGGANTNLLANTNTNLLANTNTNLLANTNANNLLGNPNANLLAGGTSANLLTAGAGNTGLLNNGLGGNNLLAGGQTDPLANNLQLG